MGPFSGSELSSFLQNNHEQKEQTNTRLGHMFGMCCQTSSSRSDGATTPDEVETPGIFIGLEKNWA